MRILITGSEGVLGTALKAELRTRGHDVFGCDLAHSSDPQVVRADISEYRQLARVFDWVLPELVYHLAGEFGRINGREFYEQMWRTNVIGTRNVIAECLRTTSMLVFASSSEAYGCADEYAPEREYFKEEWLDKYAPQFHNEYALSKWTNERQIFMAARNEGLRAIVLRFFNVYGPGEYYSPYRSVVCLFIYSLLKGLPLTVYKNAFRTHLWVGDWCRTVGNLADVQRLDDLVRRSRLFRWPGSGNSGVPVFNIGATKYESIEMLKDRLLTIIGGSSSVITTISDERANVISKMPDIAAAKLWLAHEERVTLDEGLPLTVEWISKIYSESENIPVSNKKEK